MAGETIETTSERVSYDACPECGSKRVRWDDGWFFEFSKYTPRSLYLTYISYCPFCGYELPKAVDDERT